MIRFELKLKNPCKPGMRHVSHFEQLARTTVDCEEVNDEPEHRQKIEPCNMSRFLDRGMDGSEISS